MEAGLFTLQLIDCIVADICVNGSSSARRRVQQILNLRNASSRGLAKTVQDYAQNMGDPKDESTEIKEKKRLLALVTSFTDLMTKS